MATLAELELLHGSMGELGRTFGRNRDRAQQQAQHNDRVTLAREELERRMAEQNDDRSVRREGLALQRGQERRMADYQKQMLAAKTEEQKLKVWQDVVSSGAATQETLDAMSKAMSDKLGVQVVLKMPVKDRMPKAFEVGKMKGIYNPETGNFEVDKPKPAARRTLKIGEGDKETITQDMTQEELDAAMARLDPNAAYEGGETVEPPALKDPSGFTVVPGPVPPFRRDSPVGRALGLSTADKIAAELRERGHEPAHGPPPNAAPAAAVRPAAGAVDVAEELRLAKEALAKGAPLAKVAAQFKARTGQDFPQ